MREKLENIVCWVLFGIIIVTFSLFMIAFSKSMEHCDITETYYEYIDLDNNKGVAKYCSYKFKERYIILGGGSGGQGSPICELEDGTILQVKQYKEYQGQQICDFS